MVAATDADCDVLADTSSRAFDDDVSFGAPEVGGPPGYDSAAWHRAALGWGEVFVLYEGDLPVGGAIVVRSGVTSAQLGRIWLVPECQGRGLGAQAMAAVESRYPEVRTWCLDTPTWNLRNQHFYRRCGYVAVGETDGQVLYEKVLGEAR